ncbi:B12-binding domain-containing radical SAM protein [Holophaga foetida]|uniref:B12-binding domain-containing radical SAM protein n=1 Tax=Holophaga foetida TaxID=35839 RepID=UPI00024749F3|nr:B12-binding domain-containing radical SAM protein [Holophaga foetida]
MSLTGPVRRILFLVPPNITFQEFLHPPSNVKHVQQADGRVLGSVITDIPLGVISLSAYVKKHAEVETRLIDFNVYLNREKNFRADSFQECFSQVLQGRDVQAFNPEIVAISAQFAPSYQNFLDLAACSRQAFPDALVLGGGNLPTAVHQDIFRDSEAIDAICFGEGEKAFLALVQSGDPRSSLRGNASWVTRENAGSPEACHHDFIWDLDEIPFLDYSLLDLEGYDLNPTMHYYTAGDAGRRGIPMMTSRGCPFRCIFCAAHRTHGREMRYHSVSRVIEDAARLQSEFGAETMIILDDHFMADPRRAYEMVERLFGMGLALFFPNALAVYALDRKFLELLARVGVTQVILAVESGSERVLREVMHKPLNLGIVQRVAADCRELGIYTDCNILIGLPGETPADIEEAREFLKTIHADWFRINVATPLPGSEMYEICEERHYFKEDPLFGNYKKAVIETEDFTAQYIQDMSYMMNIELNFVFNANMRLGRFDTALNGFNNVIKAKHDHPLAHYYSGECYRELGNQARAEESFGLARRFAQGNVFWENIITMFNIPVFR